MIEEFDELRKHIETEDGRKLAKEFRKKLMHVERYSIKLDTYFSDTMDGMKPEDSAKDLGLI